MSSSEPAKKIWTILELITWGTEYLSEKKIDDARLNIELLLSHVLQLKRILLYSKFDQPLSNVELSTLKELLKRRLLREPIQYILGETEFMGLKFAVDRRVLIPRPETELLVEKTIDLIKEKFPNEKAINILDIGTGSGCIAISLAKMIPHSRIFAVDFDKHALELAKENAHSIDVSDRIEFMCVNVFDMNNDTFSKSFHSIVSNPPYISKEEFKLVSKEVMEFEPTNALTDNENGLKFYPIIAEYAKKQLLENGFVGVEHAFDQSEEVRKIFRDAGFNDSIAVKDYSGINRHLFSS